MRRDHQVQQHVAGPSDDNTLFVAAVAAVLVAAGSVYILHSRRRKVISDSLSSSQMVLPASASPQPRATAGEKSHIVTPSPESNTEQCTAGDQAGDSCEPKQSRSKERRRRGKDPFKEILKGGKKNNKVIAKLGKVSAAEPDRHRNKSPPPGPIQHTEPDTSQASRSSSVAPSSSPHTIAEFKTDMAGTSISSWSTQSSSSDTESKQEEIVESPVASGPAVNLSALASEDDPSIHSSFPSQSVSNLPNGVDGKEASSSTIGTPNVAQSPSSSISSTRGSALPASQSLFPFEINEAPNITTSHSMPSYYSAFSSTAVPTSTKLGTESKRTHPPATQKSNGSWDWDGHGSSNHETTYQKPPRFRSKSRVSSSTSIPALSTSMSYGMSYPQIPSYSPVTSPSLPAPCLSSHPLSSVTPHITQSPESSHSFSFPSLNAPSPSQSPAPYANPYVLPSPINGLTGSNMTSTPQETPTPASERGDSPTQQSISNHTHVAALKSELEAARIREDKFRREAEQYAKECETLRWRWAEETAVWRRKEAELQHQILHLMHQLQAYAVYLSNPPTPTSSRLQVPRMSQSYGPHQFPPTSPQHPLSPPLQMFSPNGQTLPSLQTRTPSPFFAYPPQSPTQTQTHAQSNLLSLLFPGNSSSPTTGSSSRGPGPSPTSASASASASASSSVASLSPKLDGSPLGDRGRQRARISSRDDDWVVTEGDDVSLERETDLSKGDRDEVSELLADAILKHPENLRARTKTVDEPKRSPMTEFTFPSISSNGGSADGKDEDSTIFRSGEKAQDTARLERDVFQDEANPIVLDGD